MPRRLASTSFSSPGISTFGWTASSRSPIAPQHTNSSSAVVIVARWCSGSTRLHSSLGASTSTHHRTRQPARPDRVQQGKDLQPGVGCVHRLTIRNTQQGCGDHPCPPAPLLARESAIDAPKAPEEDDRPRARFNEWRCARRTPQRNCFPPRSRSPGCQTTSWLSYLCAARAGPAGQRVSHVSRRGRAERRCLRGRREVAVARQRDTRGARPHQRNRRQTSHSRAPRVSSLAPYFVVRRPMTARSNPAYERMF